MEAQLQRPTTHHYEDDDPHNNAMHSGEREHISPHHGEKKSVLKKVKDKAKKIKETITKHGGHSHENEYRHDQISEEENAEDDETVNAHGARAPPHESAFISGTNLPKQTGLDLEKPPGDRQNPSATNEFAPPDESAPGSGGVTSAPGLVDDVINRNARNELDPDIGRDGAVTGIESRTDNEMNTAGVELELELPTSLPSGPDTATEMEEAKTPKIGPLVEDPPHSPGNRLPLSNYETKVVEPTGQGGKEAEVDPLINRLDHLHVGDQSEVESASYTGSHDQFAPDQSTVETFQEAETMPDPENTESMPVTGKISSATSAIADKAVSANNVVATKLGYGGQQEGSQEPSGRSASETVMEYGHKVVENLAPAYEKVAGAASAIMSKVGLGRGSEDESGGTTDKGVSVRDYLAERLSPGEEDKALSEEITGAIHKRKEGMLRSGEEPPKGQAGTGVVDRVKGAVGSWVSPRNAQPEHGSAVEEEEEVNSKHQGSG